MDKFTSMRIVSINTFSHTGGASIAALRILEALNSQGHPTEMLTYYKDREHEFITPYTKNPLGERMRWLRFVYERLVFLPYEASKDIRFHFSIANAGVDLHRHPLVREADVIHMHWFNKSFLSLKGLDKLLALGKPVVWTLHDMWAFTGGCHYNYKDCNAYKNECHSCPMIRNSRGKDLSTRIWQQKNRIYQKYDNLHWVTCSHWLAGELKSSGLLRHRRVHSIPNPIPSEQFQPLDTVAIRKKWELPLDKKLVLFVAMNTNDERKGFQYLKRAIDRMNGTDMELLVIGKANPDVLETLPLKVHYKGLIRTKKEMIEIYNAGDVYVSPTLQDNLPNTVMESLACGTPVVAFETGGVPEMVLDRVEGRIVPQKDDKALADAIQWVLEDKERYRMLSQNARKKVMGHYTYETIAGKYAALFQSLL